MNGQEQKWEPISGLEGEILSIASDGHGTFQLLMETFLRDKKQWKLIQAQYQEGNGNITAKQPLRTEKNSSMVEGMDMEHTVVSYDLKKYYVYGEGCAEDGTEISCASADALFMQGSTIWSVILGSGVVEQWEIKTGKRTASFPTKISAEWNRWIFPSEDENYDCYIENSLGIYGCRKGEDSKQLFSWLEAGIVENDICCMGEENGMFFIADSEGRLYKISERSEVSGSEDGGNEIIMATLHRSDSTQRWINEFNESQEEYHVKLVSYEEYENPDERLKLDISAGNEPDIIEFVYTAGSSATILNALEQKGLLEDLYPYLDAEKDLSREDFLQKPLKFLESDGKLTKMAPGFSISCLAGAQELIGDRLTWTWEEYVEACREHPEGNAGNRLYGLTGKNMFFYAFMNTWNQYVDFSTGETCFDNVFIKQLELLEKMSGKEFYDKSDNLNTQEIPKSSLMEINIRADGWVCFSNVIDMFGKNQFRLIGYPSDSGTGIAIEYPEQYAVLSTSEQKQGAWQLLRDMWEEDFQISSDVGGCPMLEKAFDYTKECGMAKERYINENGYEVYPTAIFNGYRMTKQCSEMIDKLVELADVRKLEWQNPVSQILREEMGDENHSNEELADIIRSRVNLYINEQR